MQCHLQMSLVRHHSNGRQHGDLGADVGPPKLTHPSQDTNRLHEISSHRGLKQWSNILFGGIITGEWVVLSLWQGEPSFEIVLEVCLNFLTAC